MGPGAGLVRGGEGAPVPFLPGVAVPCRETAVCAPDALPVPVVGLAWLLLLPVVAVMALGGGCGVVGVPEREGVWWVAVEMVGLGWLLPVVAVVALGGRCGAVGAAE